MGQHTSDRATLSEVIPAIDCFHSWQIHYPKRMKCPCWGMMGCRARGTRLRKGHRCQCITLGNSPGSLCAPRSPPRSCVQMAVLPSGFECMCSIFTSATSACCRYDIETKSQSKLFTAPFQLQSRESPFQFHLRDSYYPFLSRLAAQIHGKSYGCGTYHSSKTPKANLDKERDVGTSRKTPLARSMNEPSKSVREETNSFLAPYQIPRVTSTITPCWEQHRRNQLKIFRMGAPGEQ